MPLLDGIIPPLAGLLDAVVSDPQARDAAKLELLRPENARALDQAKARIAAILAEDAAADRWSRRARPGFLYVIYVLLLWSIPMGLIAAAQPHMAAAIARGMTEYLNGIPEPLYALFGTGYLGYTAARSWGKARGVEK